MDRPVAYRLGSSPHTRGALQPFDLAEDVVGIIPAYAGSTSTNSWRGRSSTDHPRIRGEHPESDAGALPVGGSSPHTRGAQPHEAASREMKRIIPAYAGSTVRRASSTWSTADHPRIRGEHGVGHDEAVVDGGSSPHTRGARWTFAAMATRPRIIPAYAGSTRAPAWARGPAPDHPRIRGEHGLVRRRDPHLPGSSPHTRGAPDQLDVPRLDLRIIPAYAGSTGAPPKAGARLGDHPRIRGEHDGSEELVDHQDGSSPHTRGARGLRAQGRPVPGIIPACAGSTSQLISPAFSRRDHPRIRGEHLGRLTHPVQPAGSSPHTRGAHPDWRGSIQREKDHPRIRGEHFFVVADTLLENGSSPHTRGAHRPARGGGHHERIIPAYAGSTRRPPRGASRTPDHPRIRGEHLLTAKKLNDTLRIIPAYAGSTQWRRKHCREGWDHPRIRGEHIAAAILSEARAGSSPHTRGARRMGLGRRQARRIIPAYAGSTFSSVVASSSPADHPRIRGEHRILGKEHYCYGGSSPHTRGAQRRRSDGGILRRIIPAYAGSTTPPTRSRSRPADHPRIRGEHVTSRKSKPAGAGSSPHTRGAPRRRGTACAC